MPVVSAWVCCEPMRASLCRSATSCSLSSSELNRRSRRQTMTARSRSSGVRSGPVSPSPPVAQLVDGNDRATEAGSVELRQCRDLSHGAARLQAAGQQLVWERRGVGTRWPCEVMLHRVFDRSRRRPHDAGLDPWLRIRTGRIPSTPSSITVTRRAYCSSRPTRPAIRAQWRRKRWVRSCTCGERLPARLNFSLWSSVAHVGLSFRRFAW